jgi:hypothetical protein
MKLWALLYRILNRLLPGRYVRKLEYRRKYRRLKRSSLGKILDGNSCLKDKYTGRRCFILGNGPSLLDIDLSILQEEITFTVNDLFYKDDFQKINTTYHLFADPYYYDRLDEVIEKLNEKAKPKGIFIESSGAEKLKHITCKPGCPVHVFAGGIEVEDLNWLTMDLCGYLPYFCTVVQSAVAIAAYMGFQEIYLLGCDCTGIINYINRQQGDLQRCYAFDLPDEEKEKQQEICISSEHMFFEWYHIFKSYRLLREYLEKKGLKLINLTENSILDSLEKGKLNDVIKA